MDINDLHPPDDYSHRYFVWHEWIQANGPLTPENVFDYFATSMFYDKQSNNQVLRMQTMHTGMPVLNEAEELKRFTGVEFAVVHAVPPSLFVIHKRERLSPEEVRPLAAFFIMNNRIYQSPDLYTVLSNRLLTSLHSLQSSLDTLRSRRPDFTPRTGFIWPIVDNSSEEITHKKRGASEAPSTAADDLPSSSDAGTKGKVMTPSTPSKRSQNNPLLLNAMRTTAAHSNISFTSSALPPAEIVAAEIPLPAKTDARGGTPTLPSPTQPVIVSKAPPGVAPPREPPPKGIPGAGKKKRKRTLPGISATS